MKKYAFIALLAFTGCAPKQPASVPVVAPTIAPVAVPTVAPPVAVAPPVVVPVVAPPVATPQVPPIAPHDSAATPQETAFLADWAHATNVIDGGIRNMTDADGEDAGVRSNARASFLQAQSELSQLSPSPRSLRVGVGAIISMQQDGISKLLQGLNTLDIAVADHDPDMLHKSANQIGDAGHIFKATAKRMKDLSRALR